MISHQELSLKLVRAGGHYHYLPTAKKVRLAAWTLPENKLSVGVITPVF